MIEPMKPIITSIGTVPISSFGLFLLLAVMAALFIVWRLAKVYDLDEEKIFDLTLLSFFGGLLGARLFFVFFNNQYFESFEKIILINRFPGLSFWGGLLGGAITLRVFTLRTRYNFWQIADFAAVGLLIGMVIGNIGCFLGGCGYGIPSNSSISAPVVGLLGKRLPISAIESLILLIIFFKMWGQVIRFHFPGKIISLTLLYIGIEKFITEYFRGDARVITNGFWASFGHLFSLILILSGIATFYTQSKRNLAEDLKDILLIFSSGKRRREILLILKKSCYNRWVDLKIRISKMVGVLGSITNLPQIISSKVAKVLRKKLNVKSTPTDLK